MTTHDTTRLLKQLRNMMRPVQTQSRTSMAQPDRLEYMHAAMLGVANKSSHHIQTGNVVNANGTRSDRSRHKSLNTQDHLHRNTNRRASCRCETCSAGNVLARFNRHTRTCTATDLQHCTDSESLQFPSGPLAQTEL